MNRVLITAYIEEMDGHPEVSNYLERGQENGESERICWPLDKRAR